MQSQVGLRSITNNKSSGGDRIPVELLQILKDNGVKVLHSICQQIWKTQQWPQDWKRSVFITIRKKGYAKNAQTTPKLHSCHTPGGLQSMGSLGVGHGWPISHSLFTFMHWRRKWQPTPVFLPGESQGRGSLVGCRLWGRTELDTTEAT